MGVAVGDLSLTNPRDNSEPVEEPPSAALQPPQTWGNGGQQQHSGPSQTHDLNAVADSVSNVFPILTKPISPSLNPSMSMLRGTKLSVFGRHINAVEFGDGFDDTESPKSYEGLISILSGPREAVPVAKIPASYEGAKMYLDWYFKTLNPYSPTLHKPDTYALFRKIYESPAIYDSLSSANRVIVHMVLAHMKYQIGQRNNNLAEESDSEIQFKYALTFLPDLLKGQTVLDVQALALTAIHARNFQKPEAAWFITQLALSLAVEIGMHRSALVLPEVERQKFTPLEIEMRKRTFWTLYGLGVGLSGRIGRPMPLRMEDIDIEFPEALPDNLPEESHHLTEFRKCSFHVGICVSKLLALFGQLYSCIYAVRVVSRSYSADVHRLEEELDAWRAGIPRELSDPSTAADEFRIFALYIQLWELEFKFLLRHPVIHRLHSSPENPPDLEQCLTICTRYLSIVNQLCDAKCLDCPWINVTVFLAVIFTTLFVQDLRENEITHLELKKLQSDMSMWDKVMGEAGKMLGTEHSKFGRLIAANLNTRNRA
jgi:hypothetical protein